MPSAIPETRYAKSGDVNIAYQVVGGGPLDLVYVPGWISNIELMWEEPAHARLLQRLGSFSRLILFDKRGTGMSDPVPLDRLPTLEQRMDDVRAVMDAAGSERAAIFGSSEGGLMSVLFAATYPERMRALITLAIYAKRIWSPDYPWAPTPKARAAEIESIERTWGGEMDISNLAPSADEAFKRRAVAYLRRSASPGAAVALLRMNTQIDVRAVLPTIRVPTLVLQRVGDRDVNVEEGRWIAAQIPGASYVELPGDEHLIWAGDVDAVVDEVEEFVTGRRPSPHSDRVLATVLFTDIVGSTERASNDRRSGVASAPRPASRACAAGARPVSGPRGGHSRGRISRDVRRAGEGDSLRRLGPRRGSPARTRDSRRPAYRRVRAHGRGGPRHLPSIRALALPRSPARVRCSCPAR